MVLFLFALALSGVTSMVSLPTINQSLKPNTDDPFLSLNLTYYRLLFSFTLAFF